MSKLVKISILTVIFGIALVSCKKEKTVAVSSVTIEQPTSTTLVVGGTPLTLIVRIEPANATDKTVTWKSSPEAVAKIL